MSRQATCGRKQLQLQATASLLWTSSLLLFAFTHIASRCALGDHGSTFMVASLSMAAGALAAGLLSDSAVGRVTCIRGMFLLGTISALATMAAHPSDVVLLLILSAAAGVAAGGSHAAVQLVFEAVPPSYRGIALLSYPVLFFPVALLESGISEAGWSGSVIAGGLCVAGSIVGLMRLPEANRRLQGRRDNPETSAKVASTLGSSSSSATLAELEPLSISQGSAGDSLPGSASPSDVGDGDSGVLSIDEHTPLHSPRHVSAELIDDDLSVSTSVKAGETDDVPRIAKVMCSIFAPLFDYLCCGNDSVHMRAMISASVLWAIVTACYWLSSLTFYVPHQANTGYSDEELCTIYYGSASAAQAAQTSFPPNGRGLIEAINPLGNHLPAAGNHSSVSFLCGSDDSYEDTFATGAHLVAAEVIALVTVTLLVNTRKLGRRYTLSMSFVLAALSLLIAAASLPGAGCVGSAPRAALEFFIRGSLAACAQVLFLYVLELASTARRASVAGLFIATFRVGSLLTWHPGPDSRLQWTVYAMQHPYGVFGTGPAGSSAFAALTAVLVACSQACVLGAVLAVCLPVDTRLKLLRQRPGQDLEDTPPEQLVASPTRDLVATGRRLVVKMHEVTARIEAAKKRAARFGSGLLRSRGSGQGPSLTTRGGRRGRRGRRRHYEGLGHERGGDDDAGSEADDVEEYDEDDAGAVFRPNVPIHGTDWDEVPPAGNGGWADGAHHTVEIVVSDDADGAEHHSHSRTPPKQRLSPSDYSGANLLSPDAPSAQDTPAAAGMASPMVVPGQIVRSSMAASSLVLTSGGVMSGSAAGTGLRNRGGSNLSPKIAGDSLNGSDSLYVDHPEQASSSSSSGHKFGSAFAASAAPPSQRSKVLERDLDLAAWRAEIARVERARDATAAAALASRLDSASARLLHSQVHRDDSAPKSSEVVIGVVSDHLQEAEFLHQEALRLRFVSRVWKDAAAAASASKPAVEHDLLQLQGSGPPS